MSDVVLHAPFAGWFSTLDEVDDPVFAGGMMGEGAAIDPLEGVLRAPADGEVVSLPPSGHAVTLRLANGAELLLHIGLDTVALNGAGFTPQVRAGDRVTRGAPLILFDLDALARTARDLVTPMVTPGEGARMVLERPNRLLAAGEPMARITAGQTDTVTAGGELIERAILVAAPYGLHARPAARTVALLKSFAAEVELEHAGRRANARSTVALLALGARGGDTLTARARGADAVAALDALESFAAERFGDPEVVEEVQVRRGSGGICAAPGLAIGRVHQFRPAPVSVATESRGTAHERAALQAALATVDATLSTAGGDIAEAHRAMLADPDLLAQAHAGIAGGHSAGGAWQAAIGSAAAALTQTGDARLAERVADLRDIERQVLLALGGTSAPPPAIAPATILVADDLLPSQFLALDRTRLAGICTAAGGPTAHVVLLAAAAGVPMVVAAGAEVLGIADGTEAILDADAATLTPLPTPEQLAQAAGRIAAAVDRSSADAQAALMPGRTSDGTRIEVFANLGSVDDAAAAVRAGAEGCGLLRTEFLFLDRTVAPDEAEQRAVYARIAAVLGDRPLIVRTLDIGGDKPVPYLPSAREENPALGARGIRLSFARPDLLATQLRAILAAVPGEQCHIMLPMVADVSDLRRAREALNAAAKAVGRTESVRLGVMIETPAAAMLADQLATEADFLSIGTNDLTQYTLAADRGNAAVAERVDALHPAVLRLIGRVGEAARRHARPLGVCGALASNPSAAALLIGLGVTELSATPAAIPAVKAAVRAITSADAQALAARTLDAISPAEVRTILGTAA